MRELGNKQRVKLVEAVSMAFAVLILLLALNPMTKFYSWIIKAAIVVLWLTSAYIARPKLFQTIVLGGDLHYLPLYSWLLYKTFAWIVGISTNPINEIIIILSFFVYFYFRKIRKPALFKAFLVFAFVYLVIIEIYSLYRLAEDPLLSRLLASGDINKTLSISTPFLADYRLTYIIVMIAPVTLYYGLYFRRPKPLKAVLLTFYGLSLVTVFTTQYTTAILLLVVFSIAVLIKPSKNKYVGFMKWVLILAATILAVSLLGITLEFLSENISSLVLKDRFAQLSKVLSGQGMENTSSMAVRISLYKVSFETFLEHFFFGIGNAEETIFFKIGEHSTFFDFLAIYGLLGGSVFMYWLISIYRRIKESLVNYHLYRKMFVCFMILTVINTSYMFEILFAVFVIVPVLIYCFDDVRKEQRRLNKL